MIVVLMGAPGSGKGTQAHLLSKRLGFAHFSIGDFLRDRARATDAQAQAVRRCLDAGILVPDRLLFELVRDSLVDRATSGGPLVLDGFPRSVAQVVLLDYLLGVDAVDLAVELSAPDELLRRRVAARSRSDDAPDVLTRRMSSYRQDTLQVLRLYERRGVLVRIDAARSIDAVFRLLASAIALRAGSGCPSREPGTDADADEEMSVDA